MVFDGPSGEVVEEEVEVDFESLKWRMEASMAQSSLVMPHAGANVPPTFVQPG